MKAKEGLSGTKNQVAKDIETMFAGMAADIGESAKEKISEYNDRIRAVIDGKPLKINDKLEDLKIDFQRFTSIEWTEDFNLDKL